MHERKGFIMNVFWMIVLIAVVAAGLVATFALLGYAVIKKALEECFFWIDLLRHSPEVPVLVMGISISDTYIFI